MAKLIFRVRGPFVLPIRRGRGGRVVEEAKLAEFWRQHKPIGQLRGCYVFAVRTGPGMVPYYSGKATKRFEVEAFAPHKLNKYNNVLADFASGTPVLFFISQPPGKANKRMMSELERFLVQRQDEINPKHLNEKLNKQPEWGIQGIVRGRQGPPSTAVQALKRTMKWAID